MNKCILEKILLFAGILSLVVNVSYGCGDGPCRNSSLCGGYFAGPEDCSSCSPYPDPLACDECSCQYYCPQGGPWQYCAHGSGSCEEETVKCNDVVKYNCRAHGHTARYCGCIEDGDAGFDCIRVSCE